MWSSIELICLFKLKEEMLHSCFSYAFGKDLRYIQRHYKHDWSLIISSYLPFLKLFVFFYCRAIDFTYNNNRNHSLKISKLMNASFAHILVPKTWLISVYFQCYYSHLSFFICLILFSILLLDGCTMLTENL